MIPAAANSNYFFALGPVPLVVLVLLFVAACGHISDLLAILILWPATCLLETAGPLLDYYWTFPSFIT